MPMPTDPTPGSGVDPGARSLNYGPGAQQNVMLVAGMREIVTSLKEQINRLEERLDAMEDIQNTDEE